MNKHSHGLSLIEVVITIGLVSVVLISLVTLSTKSVSNSTLSREKNEATRYTQETIEWLRQERDQSWNTLNSRIDSNSTWCMHNNDWTTQGSCTTTDQKIAGTQFIREVQFNRVDSSTIEVTVVTQWMDSGNPQQSRSATILTKWQ